MLKKVLLILILLFTIAVSITLARTADRPILASSPSPLSKTGELEPPSARSPLLQIVEPDPSKADLRLIAVQNVSIEIGQEPPVSVKAVISGSWPDLCAQLAQIEQRVEGTRFEISLLATPPNPNCPSDAVGGPFRIAIPLNMSQMAVASYAVSVNGVETSFEWTGSVPQAIGSGDLPSMTLTYIGSDGNVWVLDTQTGVQQQITSDATNHTPDGAMPGETINYYFPKISSDGRLVAFRRDEGKPVESALNFTFGLWVFDRKTGESRLVYDQNSGGFAWQPSTHLLAYSRGVSEGYFAARGETETSLATGIAGIDLKTGSTTELVTPERGYALYGPEWSPDGRFLSFNEVYSYEGSGLFAYYDIETQEYIAWDEALGLYDWSPDSAQVVYDRMTYTATGEERIYLQDRLEREELQVTIRDLQGYAFYPAFSPAGDMIAYFANPGGPDSQIFTLFVQQLAGEKPSALGQFESIQSPNWSPDGSFLIFSAGPYEAQQVVAVNVADGTSMILVDGSTPLVADHLW